MPMGNNWGRSYQFLQTPQDNLCECGHYRRDHNGKKGFCFLCTGYSDNTKIEIGASPPDDVLGHLLGKREKCEKFRRWSTERVRAFWQIANIMLRFYTNREQTILDDYL